MGSRRQFKSAVGEGADKMHGRRASAFIHWMDLFCFVARAL